MMNRKVSIYKFIAYGFLAIAVFLVQTSAGLDLRVAGIRLDLLPAVVAAVALFEGAGYGTLVGGVTGVLYDLAGTGIEGLYPIFFLVFGMMAGFFGERYFKKNFLAVLVMTGAALFFIGIFRGGVSLSLLGGVEFSAAVKTVAMETAAGMIGSPIVYLAVYGINGKLKIE